ncbi:MAG: HupE/UreJ family protein, partial [Paracoccaceae bacterium]
MIRLAVVLTFLVGPAAAHGTLPGGGGFTGGFLHPLVAADHLLLLLAMGGLIGRQHIRHPVAGLLAGLALG